MTSPATMRAVQLSAPGPVDNLRLTTLPLPPERDGWVRICVEAFGLNRSELKLRLGVSEGVSFPRVPGIEAAGTVDAAPPDSGLAPGQKVVAMMGDMGRTYDGGYAEYTSVPTPALTRRRSLWVRAYEEAGRSRQLLELGCLGCSVVAE
jgi:NADPH:quinone reductase-like Zn-dependent oxidoreductase